MSRPRGEIRTALVATYSELGPMTLRESAQHLQCAQVGTLAALYTAKNMVRAGELVQCGVHKPAGTSMYAHIYELAEALDEPPAPVYSSLDDLAAVTACWASFV